MNKLEGLIYKTQPYLESSKLVWVFTKLGKVTLNARGSQKINSKDRIITQYLTLISFEYKEFKTFMYLSNAKIINDFNKIKVNYNLTKDASMPLELIDRVVFESDYNEKIYNLLIDTLNSSNIKYASLSFALKLLYYIGYGLNLVPEQKEVKGISIHKGGIVYDNENYYVNLNLEESVSIFKLTNLKIKDLDDFKLEENEYQKIKSFIYNYYLDKLDLKINALK